LSPFQGPADSVLPPRIKSLSYESFRASEKSGPAMNPGWDNCDVFARLSLGPALSMQMPEDMFLPTVVYRPFSLYCNPWQTFETPCRQPHISVFSNAYVNIPKHGRLPL
jgi:hypothetical protein